MVGLSLTFHVVLFVLVLMQGFGDNNLLHYCVVHENLELFQEIYNQEVDKKGLINAQNVNVRDFSFC
jgi:hypothetical protein